MVINPRGTSGSGKTTVVRGIMAKGITTPLGGTARKPDAYQVVFPQAPIDSPSLFIIGSYENVCGGCDSISTQDEICDRVRAYSTMGHVMMEGLLMSHLFSRYAMLDRELFAKGIPFIWAFLDTPLDLCIERVKQRREEKGNFAPLNTKNTEDKWHDMRSVYQKCTKPTEKDWRQVIGYNRTTLDARWVHHENAVEEIFSWLQ